MERLIEFESKSIRFIGIFYKILILFFTSLVISLIVIEINDTVQFEEGFIFSKSPQLNLKAPSETEIISIKVSLGQNVVKGDTLIVLQNKRTLTELDISGVEIENSEERIRIYSNLIEKAKEKKLSYENLLLIQEDIFITDSKILKQEIGKINKEESLANKQTGLIQNNYKTDSLLYLKGVLSRLEFEKRQNEVLNNAKNIEERSSELKTKQFQLNNLYNKNRENRNSLKRNIIEIENQITQYNKEILDLRSSIVNEKLNRSVIQEEVKKMYLLAPFDGTIEFLFNIKETQKIISKDELLVTIQPYSNEYYARIILPEKDLIYVKKGQKVNLRINAYNYYIHGALEGVVTHVSETDTKGIFYCLAEITENKKIHLKSGYKFAGDIIVEKMRLYNYVVKLLFRRLDTVE